MEFFNQHDIDWNNSSVVKLPLSLELQRGKDSKLIMSRTRHIYSSLDGSGAKAHNSILIKTFTRDDIAQCMYGIRKGIEADFKAQNALKLNTCYTVWKNITFMVDKQNTVANTIELHCYPCGKSADFEVLPNKRQYPALSQFAVLERELRGRSLADLERSLTTGSQMPQSRDEEHKRLNRLLRDAQTELVKACKESDDGSVMPELADKLQTIMTKASRNADLVTDMFEITASKLYARKR